MALESTHYFGEAMSSYVLRRLILTIPVLLISTMVVFFSLRLAPGDQLTLLIGETVIGDVDRSALKHQLGLDRPIYSQYAHFIANVLRGDLGRGTFDKQPVHEKILNRLPVTLELAILSVLVAITIAVPAGIISAIKRNSIVDYTVRLLALLAVSVPSFWLGSALLVTLALWFGWMPTVTHTSLIHSPLENLQQFLLPSLVLGATLAGGLMRLTRSMMLEVISEDYIRTALAKGLADRVVLLRHAMPNALIPVITMIGLQAAGIIGGTVVIESIFGLSGLGTLLTEALKRRDYPVIQGISVVLAAAVALINLFIDVVYAYIDPRLRSGGG